MKKDKALLIIDLQNDSFTPGMAAYNTEMVGRINALSATFRKENLPVIVVQHNGTCEGDYLPHTTGWKIVAELTIGPEDIHVTKMANDAFYETGLQEILARQQVEELTITGSATDFCINSTIQSALTKDYTVVVVSDGHTTGGERPYLDTEKLIEHYNWVWGNLAPTKGKILVKRAEEIE